MEALGSAVTAALIVVMTVVLMWILRDRFETVDKRFDAVDKRFDAQDERLDALAADLAATKTLVAAMHGRLEELSREIVGVRSDMLQIALAVGAKARPEPA